MIIRRLKSQKGFSLVEILVVIIILAFLATVATVKYVDSTAISRTAKTQSELEAIDVAIHLYGADHSGALPNDVTALIPDYLTVAPIGAIGDYKIGGGTIKVIIVPTYSVNGDGRAAITIEGKQYTSDTLKTSN